MGFLGRRAGLALPFEVIPVGHLPDPQVLRQIYEIIAFILHAPELLYIKQHAMIRRLIPLAFHLTPCLLLECGPDQAQKVAALAREAGFTRVAVHPDLTQRPRIVVAQRS